MAYFNETRPGHVEGVHGCCDYCSVIEGAVISERRAPTQDAVLELGGGASFDAR